MLDLEKHPLVETDWLAENIDHPRLRVLDARWRGDGSARERYYQGHLPGAAHLDWERDLSSVQSGNRFMLLPPDEFTQVMSSLGIDSSTLVIAYADFDYSGATRLWWALRYFGHTQVAVLNGGVEKWRAEGRLVETSTPSFSPTEFHPQPQSQLLADQAEIQAVIDGIRDHTRLVDTRPPEQFAAEAVWTPMGSRFLPEGQNWVRVGGRPMRAGHLPGAVHLESSDNLDRKDWTYLSRDELRQRAADAGLNLDDRIITYCGCGISASLGLFALHLAGYRDLALYDGSWEEWGTNPEHDIER